MFLKIFISSLSLLIFSFTNASAQIMHIHTGGEEQAFDLADVDSINFVEEEQHFIFEITGTNMSILITAALLNGESLVENDEIGVFTPDGICLEVESFRRPSPKNNWDWRHGEENRVRQTDSTIEKHYLFDIGMIPAVKKSLRIWK